MNFSQMQDLMLGLGCKHAINLDGGGSTKMLHNGKSVTTNATNRPVDNVIAVYLKEENKKSTIHRVQVGAFSIKKNAENYLQTVKKLGNKYSGAYITYVGGFYKIQVGAFSVRKNAENIMNELKTKGFSAFIVEA
jgi:N-acetylmuramoyl-L-alanine amidase